MLKSVRYYIYNVDRTLDLESGPIRIKDISGLNPPAASISSLSYADFDGDYLQGTRVGSRQIIMRLELMPGYYIGETYEHLRHDIYRELPPGGQIRLEFAVQHTKHPFDDSTFAGDLLTYTIDGVVESVETTAFSDNPDIVVSINCPNPYFRMPQSLYEFGGVNNPHWFDFDVFPGASIDSGFILEVQSGSTSGITDLEIRYNNSVSPINIADAPILNWSGPATPDAVYRLNTNIGSKNFTATGRGSIIDEINQDGLRMSVGGRRKGLHISSTDPAFLYITCWHTPLFNGI